MVILNSFFKIKVYYLVIFLGHPSLCPKCNKPKIKVKGRCVKSKELKHDYILHSLQIQLCLVLLYAFRGKMSSSPTCQMPVGWFGNFHDRHVALILWQPYQTVQRDLASKHEKKANAQKMTKSVSHLASPSQPELRKEKWVAVPLGPC